MSLSKCLSGCIPRHSAFFVALANGIFLKLNFLIYCWEILFIDERYHCALIFFLCPTSLLNLLININDLLIDFFGIFHVDNNIICKWWQFSISPWVNWDEQKNFLLNLLMWWISSIDFLILPIVVVMSHLFHTFLDLIANILFRIFLIYVHEWNCIAIFLSYSTFSCFCYQDYASLI